MIENNETSILRHAPCGIFITDINKNIIFWNNAMQEMSGIDSSEAINKNILFVKFYSINPVGKSLLDFSECFKGKKTKVAKTAFIENALHEQILVFINARFVTVNNELHLLVMVTDISREITCSTVSVAPLIVKEKEALQRIVGRDEKIHELYKMIEMAADSMANINISGESGTGKELVANAIHQLSARKNMPFVKVNCSALTETLLESELFGHVKGSFTGAYKDKIGKFEAAGGGSIFLDEIGEISPMIQVKLLRVIQEKVIERVGDNKQIKVDMRIITATNKNLRELVNKGLFREDLYYRLNVFPIQTPSLRERMNDLPLLSDFFIMKFNKLTGKHIKGITEDAYRILLNYNWPGNVRELENCIEHAFVICNKKLIDVYDLPKEIRMVDINKELGASIITPEIKIPLTSELDKQNSQFFFRFITKEQLENALVKYKYNRKETAKNLNISTVALWKKMKKYNFIN